MQLVSACVLAGSDVPHHKAQRGPAEFDLERAGVSVPASICVTVKIASAHTSVGFVALQVRGHRTLASSAVAQQDITAQRSLRYTSALQHGNGQQRLCEVHSVSKICDAVTLCVRCTSCCHRTCVDPHGLARNRDDCTARFVKRSNRFFTCEGVSHMIAQSQRFMAQ